MKAERVNRGGELRCSQFARAYPPANFVEYRHVVGNRHCAEHGNCAQVRIGSVLSQSLASQGHEAQFSPSGERLSLDGNLQVCERDYITRALAECAGRVTETADRLGISWKYLRQKMRKLESKSSSLE